MKNKILNVVKNELIIIYTGWIIHLILLLSLLILYRWNLKDSDEFLAIIVMTTPIALIRQIFDLDALGDIGLFKIRNSIIINNKQLIGLILIVLNIEIVFPSIICLISLFNAMEYDIFNSYFVIIGTLWFIIVVIVNNLLSLKKRKKKRRENEI